MIMLALLAAAAAAHLSNCAGFERPVTPVERSADAQRLTTALHQPVSAKDVGRILTAPGWRLVWAQPDGSEPGVFLFRGEDRTWRYLDVWGGVATDRQVALTWAQAHGHMLPHLAACFADRLYEEGP